MRRVAAPVRSQHSVCSGCDSDLRAVSDTSARWHVEKCAHNDTSARAFSPVEPIDVDGEHAFGRSVGATHGMREHLHTRSAHNTCAHTHAHTHNTSHTHSWCERRFEQTTRVVFHVLVKVTRGQHLLTRTSTRYHAIAPTGGTVTHFAYGSHQLLLDDTLDVVPRVLAPLQHRAPVIEQRHEHCLGLRSTRAQSPRALSHITLPPLSGLSHWQTTCVQRRLSAASQCGSVSAAAAVSAPTFAAHRPCRAMSIRASSSRMPHIKQSPNTNPHTHPPP
jgi:hypothetical protein